MIARLLHDLVPIAVMLVIVLGAALTAFVIALARVRKRSQERTLFARSKAGPAGSMRNAESETGASHLATVTAPRVRTEPLQIDNDVRALLGQMVASNGALAAITRVLSDRAIDAATVQAIGDLDIRMQTLRTELTALSTRMDALSQRDSVDRLLAEEEAKLKNWMESKFPALMRPVETDLAALRSEVEELRTSITSSHAAGASPRSLTATYTDEAPADLDEWVFIAEDYNRALWSGQPTDREVFLVDYKPVRAVASGGLAVKGLNAPPGSEFHLHENSEGPFMVIGSDERCAVFPHFSTDVLNAYVRSAFAMRLAENPSPKSWRVVAPAVALRLGNAEWKLERPGQIGGSVNAAVRRLGQVTATQVRELAAVADRMGAIEEEMRTLVVQANHERREPDVRDLKQWWRLLDATVSAGLPTESDEQIRPESASGGSEKNGMGSIDAAPPRDTKHRTAGVGVDIAAESAPDIRGSPANVTALSREPVAVSKEGPPLEVVGYNSRITRDAHEQLKYAEDQKAARVELKDSTLRDDSSGRFMLVESKDHRGTYFVLPAFGVDLSLMTGVYETHIGAVDGAWQVEQAAECEKKGSTWVLTRKGRIALSGDSKSLSEDARIKRVYLGA